MDSATGTKKFKWLSITILSVFLITISFHYHRNEIKTYPSYIHAWAQADQYALALGFTENGYDFFHPQTYNLNKQFPNNFAHPYPTGVTSADFPIHAYIPALLMGITGSTSPFWMRIYLLLYSLVGLIFLFLLTREISKNFLAPFAAVAFAMLSPVFLYYQATFLPTIPSLANAIIGYYFYVIHLKGAKNRHFLLALVFFTLATLARTPFAIFLFAVICQESFYFILRRKIDIRKCIGFLTSILLIFGYFLYNQHLRSLNGSIFLNLLSYTESFAQFKLLLSEVINRWGNHFFTSYHYLFLLGLTLASVIMVIVKGREKDSLRNKFGFQILIASVGSILYSLLMAKQFQYHDYYFLDSFFLPIILLVGYLSGQFRIKSKIQKTISIVVVCIFIGLFQRDAHKRVKSRQQTAIWDKTEVLVQDFADSKQLLDSLNISKEAIILVLESQTPNNAFVHMRRKGFAILGSNREEIQNAINWKYDYIVVQNCMLYPELLQTYPELLEQTVRVGGNDHLTVLRKTVPTKKQQPWDLLGLTKRVPKLHSTINFDDLPESYWGNLVSKSNPLDTANNVGYTAQNNEWSLNFTLTDSTLKSLQSIYPVFKANFFSNEKEGKILFIANYEVGNKSVSQYAFSIELNEQDAGKWRSISYILPAIHYTNTGKPNRYTVFLWNSDKKEFCYDEVSISIY
ncbi:glycosyltransferase family 39 protein [Williamwhitmania taraxaci]|nr:glycosyltransferase family 39 protein [Williamwhitmania taraxaci]